jgi:hypothetical protein
VSPNGLILDISRRLTILLPLHILSVEDKAAVRDNGQTHARAHWFFDVHPFFDVQPEGMPLFDRLTKPSIRSRSHNAPHCMQLAEADNIETTREFFSSTALLI